MGTELRQLWYNVIKGFIMTVPYHRTVLGKMHYMYSAQRGSSRKRNMDMPSYSKEEFKHWLLLKTNFIELFNKWRESGYKKMESPSVDRLDDSKPYSFDNIRLITFIENIKKSHKDRKDGKIITSQNRIVKQFTKGGIFIKEYYSIRQAARELAIVSPSKIVEVCKGRRKSAYGFVWTYKEV